MHIVCKLYCHFITRIYFNGSLYILVRLLPFLIYEGDFLYLSACVFARLSNLFLNTFSMKSKGKAFLPLVGQKSKHLLLQSFALIMLFLFSWVLVEVHLKTYKDKLYRRFNGTSTIHAECSVDLFPQMLCKPRV